MKFHSIAYITAICLSVTFRSALCHAAEEGPKPSGISITLDPAKVGAEFEGIGAVSAGASTRLLIDYPEPARSRILDWLFLPKYGAGFTHLKVEVGGEINSTDGTEPTHARSREELNHPKREYFERGYEWWLMEEAKKRNPKIVLDCLPWGAPGWIGNGDYFSQDMADYLVGFLKGAKQYHNLDINLVGCWNEKPVKPEWIKLLRVTLDTNGLTEVKIVVGDMNGSPEAQWKIADQAVIDPELAKCIYAIGVHYPWGNQPNSVTKLRAEGIRTWVSEFGEWDWTTMQPFFYKRAASMNTCFVERGFTKINIWSPISSYYDCLPAPRSGVVTANMPWSGAFEIEPTLWAVAHITQFAVPGWHFMDGVGRKLPNGGSVVGFISPDGKEVSLVIETTGASSEQTLKLNLAENHKPAALHVWRTDQMEQFIRQPDLMASNGDYNIKVDPNCIYSLTTTTGQRKGDGSSPPPAAFPLPYREDFEGYKLPATPRFFSDQGGVFEVAPRADGGKCLRQQLCRPGIDWAGGTYAYSILGDDHWNDIEASMDASFGSSLNETNATGEKFIGLLARWNPGATWIHFTTPYPAGYNLRLFNDGRWQLTTARKIISAGKIPPPGMIWQKLHLRCSGNRITASINGRVLAELIDSTYQCGLVGIDSGFHPAFFDDFIVKIP